LPQHLHPKNLGSMPIMIPLSPAPMMATAGELVEEALRKK